MRLSGFGKDHESARVFVEAMNVPWPCDPAAPGEALAAMGDQRIDERAGGMACAGMDDEARPDVLLREWLDLPRHLYAALDDGTRVRPDIDDRQVGDDRLSSVQYLKFACRGQVPVALGSDLSGLQLCYQLTPVQRQALAEDVS